jgi:hypothetical protein
MRVPRLAILALACAAPLVSGCGGMHYIITVNAASSRVEEARSLGADTSAPYEYWYAKEHLDQAQVEASAGHYSDAANYAETSEEYAAKAVEIARAATGKRKPESE